jgi:F-type H+-transporting ATPase subunit delta
MANLQVSANYAQSLLQLAIEKGVLEQIYADVLAFKKLCEDDRTLLNILQSPIIGKQKKWALLKKLFARVIDPIFLRFFDIVIQKNREALLFEMADCFITKYNEYKHIKTAYITTAITLSDTLIAQFTKLTQSIVSCKHVHLVQYIQPAILGGFILQVDDKRLDESLLTKLLWLKSKL